MTFRDGLLKARGQIAFITALAISTGVIIYLEALDTEERIESRVATAVSRHRDAPLAPSVEEVARTSLRQSEQAYAADPKAMANRATLLMALSSAVQLGVIKPDEGLPRARNILDEMGQQTETNALVGTALAVTAATFPSLQDKVSDLTPRR